MRIKYGLESSVGAVPIETVCVYLPDLTLVNFNSAMIAAL